MDVDNNHKIPGSETKDLISHNKSSTWVSGLLPQFPMPHKAHWCNTKGPWWLFACVVSCFTEENHWTWEIYCWYSREETSLLGRNMASSLKVAHFKYNPEKWPKKEEFVPCIVGIPNKNMQRHSGPMVLPLPTVTT